MKQNNFLLFFAAITICCRSEYTLFHSDLDAPQLSTIQNQWSNYAESTCSSGQIMLGGYSTFDENDTTTKSLSQVPPHFKVRVSFTLYLIDSETKIENEEFKLSESTQQLLSINPGDANSVMCSQSEYCGDSQILDRQCQISVEFLHSGDNIILNFESSFSSPLKSWGIYSLKIYLDRCYEKCSTCSGNWNNECNSCSITMSLTQNGKCQCLQDYYYSNYQCLPLQENMSACEISLISTLQDVVFLPSSIIYQNGQTDYIRISVELSFSLVTQQITESCKSVLGISLFYLDNDVLKQIPSSLDKYITQSPNQIEINVPSQLFFNEINILLLNNASLNLIQLQIQVRNSNTNALLRTNMFSIYFQNSNSFAVNLDPQITDGCNPQKDDCVVIGDTFIQSLLCSDNSCLSARSNSTFTVGDSLIIKVTFRDPSILKYIVKQSVYIKSDQIIYNVSNAITVVQSIQGKSIFSIPLLSPTQNGIIQLSVLFQDQARLLEDQSTTISHTQDSHNNTKGGESENHVIYMRSFTVSNSNNNQLSSSISKEANSINRLLIFLPSILFLFVN